MQSLKDAAILLAILLAVATVRIAPTGHGAPAVPAARGVQAAEPALDPDPIPDADALCAVPLELPQLDASRAAVPRVMVFQVETVEVQAAPRTRPVEGRRVG